MFFHDMAGVFYAVIFGLLISLFVLLGEITWAANKDKKQNKVNKLCFKGNLHSDNRCTVNCWE